MAGRSCHQEDGEPDPGARGGSARARASECSLGPDRRAASIRLLATGSLRSQCDGESGACGCWRKHVLLVAGFSAACIRLQQLEVVAFRSGRLCRTTVPFSTGAEMAKRQHWQEIPTELSLERFREFVLPHLSVGSRGPAPKLSSHTLFNYVLKLLYLGCQWKELPIEKDDQGREEIHYTGVYRAFRRWEADGCFDAIFEGTVLKLHRADLLDAAVIHGDGTTTAAKKGGDNIGFSGHKKVKGDKVVAFCDRKCNVIAPFISAPGNQNESPLLREALPAVMRIADSIELDLRGTIVSLDGVYDCRRNRKAISIAAWCQTLTPIPGRGDPLNAAASHFSTLRSSRNGLAPLSACLVGRTNSAACCSGLNVSASCITHSNH